MNWFEAGRIEDIPPRGARTLEYAGERIALFRTAGDEVFALRDRCPHRGGPLSQGIVCGRQVTCPLHEWRIALDSGTACAPDEGATPGYRVRVRDGVVWLAVEHAATLSASAAAG